MILGIASLHVMAEQLLLALLQQMRKEDLRLVEKRMEIMIPANEHFIKTVMELIILLIKHHEQ